MAAPPNVIDAESFQKACASFQNVSRETINRLRNYEAMLRKWQKTINLVAAPTLDEIWNRHFFDSAQLLRFMPGKEATLTDLGSGAGFPGLVLAIFGCKAHLIEADKRKAAFLAAVIGELGLDAQLHIARIEATPPVKADFVTARALAPLPLLLQWAAPYLRLGATGLFLKGAQSGAELTDAKNSGILNTYRIHDSLSEPSGSIIEITEVANA